MVTFEHGIDARCREPSAPIVARILVRRGLFEFCVIGTAYGYWHTAGGDVRTWKTASGARRAARRYVPL